MTCLVNHAAQFNGRVLSSFQCGQAFSDLFLSAMCEL